ncbi:MAG: glycine cleavage system protein H [Deltaproteobacteria bacterium]|nr:glycine cleavage system protein H [Deltaproteobacteria bacterium]
MGEFLETTYEKFIFKVKVGYLYSHEEFWANFEDGAASVGLTDFMQKAKGDVAFLETVEPGTLVKRGDEIGKIETIKATFGIISPVSGKMAEVNPEMDASPYLINHDPYGTGWIYRIELSDPDADKAQLMDAKEYFEAMKDKIAREAKKLYG